MIAPLLLVTVGTCALAQTPDDLASAAIRAAQQRVPRLRIVELPAAPGELALAPEQSLTADQLRGVALDDEPPVCGPPAKPYPAEHSDGFAPGQAPYGAPGIQPFRLREFTAEFNYGGWHNLNMMEYAATHGFSVIYPYVMEDTSHFPPGTRWLKWGSFVDWRRFFADRILAWGRYDLLAERDVVQELLDSGAVWQPGPSWISMIDLEHGSPLSPDELKGQTWYPRDAPEAERRAFEDRYYRGYALTYLAPVEALRRAGWGSVGVYPQPYGSGWYALLGLAEKGLPGLPDPATHWPWLRYGRVMVEGQDVLYPDVYTYYWSPQNVAYTLARIDFDMALVRSMPEAKPVRPYFWPLLHGGDAEPHWWAQQPLPNEDMRAMVALACFAGCDGPVIWNWSDVGNHHVPPPLWRAGQTTAVGDQAVEGGVGGDVMVRERFLLRPEGAAPDGPMTVFDRYDVLAITERNTETGLVRFQHIDTSAQKWGPRLDPAKPTYAMPEQDLLPHLRAPSEPVAGVVEGLAMVKLLEPLLRHGEVKVDVPALDQYVQTLPIVRRVKLGGYHVLATYNPLCVQGGPPRTVTLSDFDGRAGLTVALPADQELRIFILRER